MANHCVDVICLDCGRQWCVRGCNYSREPSQEAIDSFKKRSAEWEERHKIPHHIIKTSDVCDCGSKNVVHE